MTTPLKLAFAGTPDFAVPSLQALISAGHDICAVYTQPDKKVGRGRQLQLTPVKQCAVNAGIPVFQPTRFRDKDVIAEIIALNLDALIVVAYGHILPQAILDAPKLGCINVHASLLPRWRGAAPIQAAIAAGECESGVTIMQMEAGLDTGPMLASASVEIEHDDTGGSLHNKLAALGASLLPETLMKLATGAIIPTTQNDKEATYAHKIEKASGKIDWSRPAIEIERQIRAYNPWPVCFSQIDDTMIRIWRARVELALSAPAHAKPGEIIATNDNGIHVATGEGVLVIGCCQLPGKAKCESHQLLQGYQQLFSVGKGFSYDSNV